MAEKLTMPKTGMMEADSMVTKWLKAEGDVISIGDIVADIENGKTTTQLESYVSGTILKIILEEGIWVPIGSTVAIVGETGEDISSLLEDE